MANGPILKLQPGAPGYTMTLKYVDFRPATNPQYGDQISVKGDVDGQGQGCMIYLPISQEGKLQQLGVIGTKQNNNSYQILRPGCRVTFSKVAQGNRSVINCGLDGQAPASGQTGPVGGSGNAGTPSNLSKKDQWEALYATADRCFEAAIKLAEKHKFKDEQGIIATANTLFIQRVRDGLLCTVKTTDAAPAMVDATQLERITSEGVRLLLTAEQIGADILKRYNAATLGNLTFQQASEYMSVLALMQPPPPPAPPEDLPF